MMKKIYFFTSSSSHLSSAYKMFLDNKIIGVGVKILENFAQIKNIIK